MEYIVDAQQAFGKAVRVHVSRTAFFESILQEVGENMVGVGRRERVQVSAQDDWIWALSDNVADDLRLSGTFDEVFQQGACGVFHGFHFPFAVVGSKLLLPFASVLVYAGRLQVIIHEADGVRADKEVAHQTAVVRPRMRNETLSADRVAAEYGDG